jgi:hypothetical protein
VRNRNAFSARYFSESYQRIKWPAIEATVVPHPPVTILKGVGLSVKSIGVLAGGDLSPFGVDLARAE